MVFEIRVDARGRTRKTRLHRARIESRAQLTFAAVEAFLADPRRRGFPERGVNESLLSFAELGRALMADADRRDVVRYRRTECEVKLRGHPDMRFVLTGEVRSQVELYNEQLSLLCNVEGAKYLGEPEARSNAPARDLVQPIFRVHQPPDPNRYRALESLITGLVRAHRLRPEPWCWKRSDTSLADYLSALPEQGEHGRIARAIHRQAMLLNPRSWFSEEPGPHHGIGAEHYARFSSPMREIVGVFLHKEANEKLTGVPTAVPQGHPDDDELRRRIVARANEAKELQRQLTKEANRFVLDRLFEDELRKDRADRKSFAGTVMGISPGKVHVLLDDPPVEVKVYGSHLERLRRARLSFPGDGVTVQEDRNGNTSTLCRVGDAVRVTLIDRDRRGDRWVMRLGGNEGAP
jgi:ribonuclease R